VGLHDLHSVKENLRPIEFVESATTRSLSSFLLLYADTHLLLVRLRDLNGDLETVLSATQSNLSPARAAVKPTQDGMAFHTEIHRFAPPRAARAGASVSGFDSQALAARLREGRYFAVPLRKRASVDALSMDRISVGRARNKDIVLRDASVSKFHGWFEMDEYRTFHFADAGSKNGTTINGRRLEPRQPVAVNPGDALVFGSVEGLLCAPDLLWKALNGAP
jgi:hypothetical protein